MLIGGMFDLDIEKALTEPVKKDFSLRCDIEGQYKRKVFTNNGRTATTYAMQYGVKLPKGKKVLLPEYNCISVINAFEAVDAEFIFYKVKPGLIIDIQDLESKVSEDCGLIYVIHYFGVPQPEEVVSRIVELAEHYHICIMEDITQTFFTRGKGRIGFGHYLVASVRKWLPVTDGGIVAARNDVPFEIAELQPAYDEAAYTQMFLSLVRKEYVLQPQKNPLDYLNVEKMANRARYLDFTPRAMTKLSENILYNSDFALCIRKRRENYNLLYQLLKDNEDIRLYGEPLDENGDHVPFGFVIEADDRDELYRYLAEKGIIGEIQWILPTEYYNPAPYAAYMTRHSLMLQCDQRYGEREMKMTAEMIGNYTSIK